MLVTVPAELEVAQVVWARSLVVTEAALPLVQGRADIMSLHPAQVLIRPS